MTTDFYEPYRILVTGSRDWCHLPRLYEALETAAILASPRRVIFVQGGARGVDTDTKNWAVENGYEVITYPAEWRKNGIYNPQAGLLRNREMVEAGADVALAFIRRGSRGATHCADLAEEAGIPTRRILA